MQVGYARVSNVDGNQTVALQRDALITEDVVESHIYEDAASGKAVENAGSVRA